MTCPIGFLRTFKETYGWKKDTGRTKQKKSYFLRSKVQRIYDSWMTQKAPMTETEKIQRSIETVAVLTWTNGCWVETAYEIQHWHFPHSLQTGLFSPCLPRMPRCSPSPTRGPPTGRTDPCCPGIRTSSSIGIQTDLKKYSKKFSDMFSCPTWTKFLFS